MSPPDVPVRVARRIDRDSMEWVERLRAGNPERDAAIGELHALLVRAARFEVNRRQAALPHLRGGDHEDLAHQSADDALVALLGKLDEFRGESRFTMNASRKGFRDSTSSRLTPVLPINGYVMVTICPA